MSLKKLVWLLIFAAALPALARAQAPAPAAPAKPDSPEVKALIEKAKQAGGAMWAEEAHFFCEAPRANSATDPAIVPTKIFDNVYAIGNSGTTVYVIQTSDGLLMIDALGAAQVETLLLPGLPEAWPRSGAGEGHHRRPRSCRPCRRVARTCRSASARRSTSRRRIGT